MFYPSFQKTKIGGHPRGYGVSPLTSAVVWSGRASTLRPISPRSPDVPRQHPRAQHIASHTKALCRTSQPWRHLLGGREGGKDTEFSRRLPFPQDNLVLRLFRWLLSLVGRQHSSTNTSTSYLCANWQLIVPPTHLGALLTRCRFPVDTWRL